MDAHVKERYRVETRRLVARRGFVGTAIFIGGVGLAAVLEYSYNHERLPYLFASFAVEILICLAAFASFRNRRLRRHGVKIVLSASVSILLCISLYGGLADANPAAIAFIFIVFELATALLFPWGTRNQAVLAAAGALFYSGFIYNALIEKPAGSTYAPPVVYGLYAVAVAGVLSVLGSAFLNRQRYSLFAQREQLDQHIGAFRDLTRTFHEFDPQRIVFLSCVLTLETFRLRRLWVVWQTPGNGNVQGYFVSREGKHVSWAALTDTEPLWVWSCGWNTKGAAFVASTIDPGLPAALRRATPASLLCIPIGSDGERLGAICADRGGELFEIGDRQLALASVLASGTTIAMENALLYQRVAAASDEKSLFLARIAHELRNPLQAMLWDLDAAQEAPRTTPEQLERLRQNTLMTIAMAKELQEFAEIETRRLTASHEPVNLAQTIDNLRVTALASLEGRPIELVTHVAADADMIVTDPFRLRQILGNLIANATKFTTRGTIGIEARRAGKQIEISVRDTGAGIEEADLSSIFTPFYRGPVKAHAGVRGMGLGLAIAREIANVLGGSIKVESALGRGSTFRVFLPVDGVAADQGAAAGRATDRDVANRATVEGTAAGHATANDVDLAATGRAAAQRPMADHSTVDRAAAIDRGGQRRPAICGAVVLLIEDDESYRDRVAEALRRGGAKIVEAREGSEGLRYAREHRPTVVILDLGLPGLSGLEVLSELKRDPLLADIPVVIATAEADSRVAAHCHAVGSAAYVIKPYTPAELLDVVAPLLAATEQASRPSGTVTAN